MGDTPDNFSDHDRTRSSALLTCVIVVILALGGVMTSFALAGVRHFATNSNPKPLIQAWFSNPTKVNHGVTPGEQLQIEYLGSRSGRVGVIESWTRIDGTIEQLKLSFMVEAGRRTSFLVTVPTANASSWFELSLHGVRIPLQVWVL